MMGDEILSKSSPNKNQKACHDKRHILSQIQCQKPVRNSLDKHKYSQPYYCPKVRSMDANLQSSSHWKNIQIWQKDFCWMGRKDFWIGKSPSKFGTLLKIVNCVTIAYLNRVDPPSEL